MNKRCIYFTFCRCISKNA